MSHILNSDYRRSVTHFAYFCMNYPANFMDAFKNDPRMQKHLQAKFEDIYHKHGSSSVMLRFFLELDTENQETLLYWVKTHYTGYKL